MEIKVTPSEMEEVDESVADGSSSVVEGSVGSQLIVFKINDQ
jgi:hypothetical protein